MTEDTLKTQKSVKGLEMGGYFRISFHNALTYIAKFPSTCLSTMHCDSLQKLCLYFDLTKMNETNADST